MIMKLQPKIRGSNQYNYEMTLHQPSRLIRGNYITYICNLME